LSISEESKEWIKLVGTPELLARRERILERFRRPEREPIYSPATTKELIRLENVVTYLDPQVATLLWEIRGRSNNDILLTIKAWLVTQ
jgi:hypothetical protein